MEQYSVELKAKPFAIISGKHISIIHEDTAKRLGIYPLDRIEILNRASGTRTVTVIDTTDSLLRRGEIGLFEEVTSELEASEGQRLSVTAAERPKSIRFIKKKLKGIALSEAEIRAIVEDIDKNRLSDIETSSFMTAAYIHNYTLNETVAMAQALTDNGRTIELDAEPVVDKHSIGGINGRATMIIVPIVASADLFIPKTSSRSITSASGTADAMEVLANVKLSIKQIKEITEGVGGVIAWGGALDLAPVDDKIIKIEHPLSLDPHGQVIASVIAKKASVGSEFVVIDIPIGPGLKISEREQGSVLAEKFISVGRRLGMRVEAVLTDGSQPSGKSFGASLEAMSALRILEGKLFDNLAQKSCELSGVLFELAGKSREGRGFDLAKKLLSSGKALKKMKQIINAQGKKTNTSRSIEPAPYSSEITIDKGGEVSRVNVKKLVGIAKASGAPHDKKAGLLLNAVEGDKVERGGLLYTIFAENRRKLALAEKYAFKVKPVEFEKIIIEKIA